MQVWDIDNLSVIIGVYRLAKSTGFKMPVRRGPKGYKIAVRITIVAYVILSNQSYVRALKSLKRTYLMTLLRLKNPPSPASITRWKKALEPYARALIRRSFLMLGRGRTRKLIGVIDGSGFKLTRASEHYLKRVRKKAPFLLVTLLYAPEIDGIYDLVAAPDMNSENRAFWTYLFRVVVFSGLFWGIVADKRLDDGAVTEWLEAYHILTFIPARGGKLKPSGGPRFRADLRYRLLKAFKNFRSLIESGFSSIKSFVKVVKTKLASTNEVDALLLALVYNVSRLIKKGYIVV